MRDYNAEGKLARGRNWTIALLLRHTAYHALDHAWEMEDKDLSRRRPGLAANRPNSHEVCVVHRSRLRTGRIHTRCAPAAVLGRFAVLNAA